MRVSGQHHAPAALYSRGKDPGTHCTGGWVGPRAGLDTEARGKILRPRRGIDTYQHLNTPYTFQCIRSINYFFVIRFSTVSLVTEREHVNSTMDRRGCHIMYKVHAGLFRAKSS
jgi:hypothetical protein